MNRQNLKKFASQVGISEKTLKRNFGDCIYRLGRQSFIDVDTYNQVFAERAQKGRKDQQSITESNSIGRIQMNIPKKQLKIRRMHIEHADLEATAKVEKNEQKKTVLLNNARRIKIGIQNEETLLEKMFARIDELNKYETKSLLALEAGEVGGSEKK